jgi:hypothetical protein
MAELILPVSADTYVKSYSSPTENYGDLTTFKWGKSGANVSHRAFIKFDLSSYPYGTDTAPINSALFKFYQSGQSSDGKSAQPIYRITSTWAEDTVTWNTKPTFSDWLVDFDDRTSSVWHSLDITTAVENWLDGTWDNYGLMIAAGATSVGTARSKEYADSDYHPYLLLDYEPIILGGVMNWWFIKDAWEKHDKIFKPKILKPEFVI